MPLPSDEKMKPTEQDKGLRAYVLSKTILQECIKFLRHLCERIAEGKFGEDAQSSVMRLSNSYTFSQSVKEMAVAQMHLLMTEHDHSKEEWFEEFVTASIWLLDQMVLASPAQEILTTWCSEGNRGACDSVAESILRAGGLKESRAYWNLRDEISRFIEHSAGLRAKLLDYALTQEPSILNDYIFTIQLFEKT